MRRRTTSVAIVAALVLAGCGPRSHLSIDMRSVSITVPRLITPAVELVPEAPVPPPPSLPSPPAVFLPPVAPSSPVATRGPAPPQVQTAPACPTADSFAVPARPASPDVTARPAADQYKQMTSGSYSTTQTLGTLGGTVDTIVVGFPRTKTSGGQDVDTWAVQRTDVARKGTSMEVYQLVYPSSAGSPTSPGIYLVGLAWDDPIRGKLRFLPTGNGLWVLPSPVQLVAGSSIQYFGVATDPNTLTTLELNRNITGRKRVDACGRLIDTFTVEMTGVLTTPDVQRQLTWTMQVATSYGGLDVEHTFSLTSPVDGFTWTRTVRNTAVPKDPS
jgi:hypothetical protein